MCILPRVLPVTGEICLSLPGEPWANIVAPIGLLFIPVEIVTGDAQI